MVSGAPRDVALVFPGQGSQAVGMGKALHEANPPSRQVYERADRALGYPLSRTCFEGPEEALRLTATTQPAVLVTSLAALAALRATAPQECMARVVCAAGHSLGEYSALVAAGALELDDAVRAVRRRGEHMQAAVPDGAGAMVALLGAPLEVVDALCREAAAGEVLSPANLNAPDQTVVAGTAAAVDRLAGLARSRGIRKVVRLPVSAPFHCALMEPARERLAQDLAALSVRDAAFPVVQNVSARAETRGAALREALVRQVTAPVRWVESVIRMKEMGVRTLIEVGPGRVLCGLARRIAPDLALLNVEDPASLGATLGALGAARS
ncbi:MAG: [acyl-carrier-protein] S-malonyltransferase [Acidobacteria bacterium]|nr:MAG: [acyl-carrier-protein] S-malonyltransferase [Acidobacteriota bacterium]